ncbi:Uncharacterised protein [Mycobacterium tuberculosis]|nr:Uncharacterised protein [Mycobacterium tuberculosis]
MADGISTYLSNQILNHLTSNNVWTPPPAIYAQLHVDVPGPLGLLWPSAGDTSRKLAVYAASTNNSAALLSTLGPWTSTAATQETLAYVSFWDAVTGGNFLWSKKLPAPFTWSSGDVFSPASATLSMAQLAA